jgi:OmpA-OmpF porin, OOP family
VIQRAVDNYRRGTPVRIVATGHADRVGPPDYNQNLSERRAAAVREALLRAGLPANQITTVGRGEEQPLVPTPDGVREAQNRRVEIALQ